MAELLVKSIDHVNPISEKDRRGAYKRGMFVIVMPDGHEWGQVERDRGVFALIKVPLVPIDRVEKYVAQWMDTSEPPQAIQRRRWRIRWADLPAQAQTLLRTTGILTIKARAEYTGAFDYTWTQVRQYFRNDETGLDETEDP